MWEIISNPVTLSVIVMCVLCLCKLNVILSLLISALVAGFTAGMGPAEIMGHVITGINGNGTNAIAYLLLGTFAAALAQTGLATMLARWIASMVKARKWILLLTLVVCAIISGTIIPVHIAYIPVLIPPLLLMMNKMKMDRRQAACVTEFGLVAPYVTIPLGYGVIFQGIVADNMTANGMPIEMIEVWPYTIILGAGMLVGLIASWWFYRKPRDYQEIALDGYSLEGEDIHFNKDHVVSLIAIAGVLFGQLYWDSMPLGALLGIMIMIVGGAIKLKNSDGTIAEGIRLMGMVSFIMLIAGGYAYVVNQTGAVDTLIDATLAILGNSKIMFVTILILIGLLITMGIGTSFGTIPVIALFYVPMCMKMNMSVGATACLIACAAALGDAGSPASDSTLGPTSGLNADGQHDHIWDTCVPTFFFYNIPLAIAGFIGGMIL
ncbi:MAG: SLC13 family permease [Clostridium sp.]